MIDILRTMESLTRIKSGCQCCCVYEQLNVTHAVLYVEQWESRETLQQHVRSSMYMRLLTAMELSSEEPEIQFHEVSETRGLEFIEEIRSESGG
jgi:quinol monooxygenase YgiN